MNFVFDIDGTLCFDGKTIDISIIEALNELSTFGHEIIFASARPIRDLVPVLPPHLKKGKLVGGNGCFISDNEGIKANHFVSELMEQLHIIIQNHQLTYLADGEWDYAFTGSTDHPIYKNINHSTAKNYPIMELQKICKLVLFKPSPTVIEELQQLPVCITSYKHEDAIDISPLGINKVYGLEQLQVKEFIAFGNDSNDQCLFENARYSVCVGDNEVHKYASIKISKDDVAETIVELKNSCF
nr:HAD family hydrolase [Lysinibacillus timonensis]